MKIIICLFKRMPIKPIVSASLLIFLLFFLVSFIHNDPSIKKILIQQDAIEISLSDEGQFINLSLNKELFRLSTNYYSNLKEIVWDKAFKPLKDCGSTDLTCFTIEGKNNKIHISRVFVWNKTKLEIKDTIINFSKEEVLVSSQKSLFYPKFLSEVHLAGVNLYPDIFSKIKGTLKYFLSFISDVKNTKVYSPENPSFHVKSKLSSLGFIHNDIVSKVKTSQFNLPPQRQIKNITQDLLLSPENQVSFNYSLYPQSEGSADYFSFVNLVRKELNLNSQITGQFIFFDIFNYKDLLSDPQELKDYLSFNHLKLIVLTPWLDYDNFNSNTRTFIDREMYVSLYKQAAKSIKAINQDIKILGAIQSNLISLPLELKKEFIELGLIDRTRTGMVEFSKSESEFIKKNINLLSTDYVINKQGNLVGEIQFYGIDENSIEVSLAVIPRKGGAQEEFIYSQVDFLLNKVGLDGFYLDQFNQNVNILQRFSYGTWDGLSFDGEEKYESTLLTTESFQKDILKEFLSKDVEVVTNSSLLEKSIHNNNYHSFYEGFGEYYANAQWNNTKHDSSFLVAKGHFSDPVALGIPDWLEGEWKKDYKKVLFKNIIFNLRNGSLFYHNQTDFGNFSNEKELYRIFNYMFPFVPSKLGKGWILGKEKLISAISKDFLWPFEEKPQIKIFNHEGLMNNKSQEVIKIKDGWKIQLRLNDWNEVAVII